MSKAHSLQETAPASPARALSPPKAARYLGCGKTKLWSLIVSGRIPSKRLDGRTLILTSDLDAFLDGLPATAVREARS